MTYCNGTTIDKSQLCVRITFVLSTNHTTSIRRVIVESDYGLDEASSVSVFVYSSSSSSSSSIAVCSLENDVPDVEGSELEISVGGMANLASLRSQQPPTQD